MTDINKYMEPVLFAAAMISKDRLAGIFLMTSWKHRVDAVLLNPALSLAGFPGSLTNQNGAGADSNAALKYNHTGKSISHPALARGITPPAGTITAYIISNGRIAIVFPRLAPTNARLSPSVPWTAFTNGALALANSPLEIANDAKSYSNGQHAQSNDAKSYSNGQHAQSNDAKLYTNGQYAQSNDAKSYTNGQYAQSSDAKLYTNGQHAQSNGAKSNSNGRYAQADDAKSYTIGAILRINGRKLQSIDVNLYVNGAKSYTDEIQPQSSAAISFSIGAHSLLNGALVHANARLIRAKNDLALINGAHKKAYELVKKPYLRFTNNNAYKSKQKINQFEKEVDYVSIWIRYLILFREIVNRIERT